ncbi:MAG: hypothetical protein ABJA82_15820 [Myxococcales bacterium]
MKHLEVAGYHNGFQLTSINLVPAGVNSAASGLSGMGVQRHPGPDSRLRERQGKRRLHQHCPQQRQHRSGGRHPASTAFDIYYDDIVLDSKRLNCLP